MTTTKRVFRILELIILLSLVSAASARQLFQVPGPPGPQAAPPQVAPPLPPGKFLFLCCQNFRKKERNISIRSLKLFFLSLSLSLSPSSECSGDVGLLPKFLAGESPLYIESPIDPANFITPVQSLGFYVGRVGPGAYGSLWRGQPVSQPVRKAVRFSCNHYCLTYCLTYY